MVVYPTDSAYAIGCHIGDKNALDRIRRIRKLDDRHNFTLVCRDLSEIATYSRVDNRIIECSRPVRPVPILLFSRPHRSPARLMHAKRKTVGLRVPDNQYSQALLDGSWRAHDERYADHARR